MVQNGETTALYLQKELIGGINLAMEQSPDIYTSRNIFINSAIARELRRLKSLAPEENQTCRTS